MPYPEDALAAHEQLVLKLHPHWWYIAKAGLAFVATLVVGGWLLAVTDVGLFRTLVVGALIVEALWFAERVIRWRSIFFVLTSERVMSRAGVIAKHGIEIPLDRINTVVFQQGFFERILGLGNLVIESASAQGAQVFRVVQRPSDVQKQVYVQMEARQNRTGDRMTQAMGAPAAPAVPGSPPAAAPAAVPSISDQINELAALRDQGHLTAAEFEAKKQELLDRM